MMNWDTNGLFQVMAPDGVNFIAGSNADNRAVAVIFAPGTAIASQSHPPITGTTSCGGDYTPSHYLDNDTVHNINNASPDTTHANTTSRFITGQIKDANGNLIVNDQLLVITKQDIWNALQRRNNFLSTLNTLTQKIAECIAYFGTHNKISGTLDTRNKSLPWAAPLSLSDYSVNTQYNDIDGLLAGHVPYRVNTSRSATGNTIPSLYYLLQADGANCPAGWADYYPWWDNWKDHLFYAVSQRYSPDNGITGLCDSNSCLNINGTADRYAAVVIFANSKLTALNQIRNSSVTDTQRGVVSNYLEGRNVNNMNNPHSHDNFEISTVSSTFNDIVYCIKPDLSVAKGDLANLLLIPPKAICP